METLANPPTATETPEEETTIPPPVEATPEGWNLLSEPGLGIQFAYPPDWEICTSTKTSRVFCRNETGAPSFPVFYITVIPDGFTNQDAEAYNFIPAETLRRFQSIETGSSLATNPIPEYSTFTRLEDSVIDGREALVIENTRVWEAANPETRDRRVVLVNADGVTMIGTYTENPDDIDLFETVLGTVQILN